MEAVRCPECRQEVSIDPADFGYEVACPLCGERFTPRSPGQPPPRDAAGPPGEWEDDAGDERPRRRRRRWDDEDEDYDERPARRRRPRRVDWEEAERLSAGPATGLILTGWISAALSLIGGVALLVGGMFALDAADPDLEENAPIFIVYGVLFALFGTPYFTVMAIGGHKLRRLSGIGWVYTAAVMGIATIATCGPCMPFTWAALPVGIWAVVALTKPDVKGAFDANREG